MNLKGYIKVFTAIFLLVCIYQLMFTVVARMTESKADDFAQRGLMLKNNSLSGADAIAYEDSIHEIVKTKKRNFLDSIANVPTWFFKYTYRECKDKQLNLGLDLKGGMSMVLEISEDDVLRKMSENNRDAAFNNAIEEAKKMQASSKGDFLTLFNEAYSKANPNGKLSAIFASLPSYQNKLSYSSTNDEVIKVLRKDMGSAVQETYRVLKTRIDQFGVGSPNISLQTNTGRIILELPGVEDPTRIRKILQQTAQLEFWDTYENEEIIGLMVAADKALGERMFAEDNGNSSNDTSALAIADSSKISADDLLRSAIDTKADTGVKATGKPMAAKKDSSNLYPIRSKLMLQYDPKDGTPYEGPMVGYALGKDTATLNKYLQDPLVRAQFPRDLRLLWSNKAINKERTIYGLYAIKTNPAVQEAPLTGDVITDAYKSFDQTGSPEVDLSMNSMGSAKWEKMTEAAVNGSVNGRPVKKCVAIVLDNRVFSSPRVQSKISGGRTQITGIGDIQEADDLANILKSGKLQAKTRIIEEQVIGPSLGKESIRSGLLSMLIGFVIVCLFMIAYYSTSGIVANIAVVLNLFFIISVLANFGAALTLPGMAGIVLTLAIAIDANVIINERIREELAKGKTMRTAVADGYKHSYSAIFDGNITTLIVGFVLTAFGYGPVRGFAITLVIGIITSLFTAVGFSQIVFDFFFARGINVKMGNNFTMNLLKGINFRFMEKRKMAYAFSGFMFAVSFAAMIFIGFDLGVAFQGGRSYVVKFDKDVKTADIAAALEKPLGSRPLVKTYGSNSQIQITTAYQIGSTSAEIETEIEQKLYQGLGSSFIHKPTFDAFRAKHIKSITRIDATIADDIRRSALSSGLLGCLFIFIYIYIRFRRYEYSVGAVIATIHDPIIIMGLFALLRHIMPFSLEVDENVVAAILTLIGYSVNDTVIVYDRIREFLKLYPTKPLIENVNNSINTTLSRTIMTSVATELVCVVLFIFGGDAIRQFSFALMVGIIVGTYSSVFIASPIVVDLMLRKKGEKK